MKSLRLIAIATIITFLAGCAAPLNSIQKSEYMAMEADGVLVEEKDPGTGAVLGILPGFGSFYARKPGLGIINFLFWPLSVLWDPISGYEGSKVINYTLTKHKLKKDMRAEMSVLDDKLTTGEIDNIEYVREKSKIQEKYQYD